MELILGMMIGSFIGAVLMTLIIGGTRNDKDR